MSKLLNKLEAAYKREKKRIQEEELEQKKQKEAEKRRRNMEMNRERREWVKQKFEEISEELLEDSCVVDRKIVYDFYPRYNPVCHEKKTIQKLANLFKKEGLKASVHTIMYESEDLNCTVKGSTYSYVGRYELRLSW